MPWFWLPVLPSAAGLMVQPVQVKLTSEEATVFHGLDWLQVADSVLTVGDVA